MKTTQPEALIFRCHRCGGVNRVAQERVRDHPVCGRCKGALDLSGHPADVDDDALEALVASCPVPVLVDLWAPWCGPCRMVAPVVEALAREHSGHLVVVKLNTDQHQRTLSALGARGIPTFAVYHQGRLRHSQSGALPRSQLEALVAPYL